MPTISKTTTAVGLLILLVLLGACRDSEPESGAGSPGVVILITVDGLVPSKMQLFGGDVAIPALDRVASMGRAWGDAWTAAPMTRPGVATYLTGLAPDRHRIRDDLFTSLDDDQPTLATAFSEAGYRTAAFPDSSFLGASSGLLRDFEVVADPPMGPINPARWYPSLIRPAEVAGNFTSWVDTLPDDARYFAWIHFSGPLSLQLWDSGSEVGLSQDPSQKRARRQAEGGANPPGPERLEEALTLILDRLEQRGDLKDALVVVAGTQADATGGTDGLAGPGFSVGASAVRVPVILGWSGATQIRSREQPVWAPDVTATIVQAADLDLSADAEGISLLESVPVDRIVFSWSWASLDQMGWRAQRVAQSGPIQRVEGFEDMTRNLDDPASEVAQPDAARLAEALASRAEPAAPAVPLERVRPILEARGLVLHPVPSEGRTFGDADTRREASMKLLGARTMVGRQRGRRALMLFGEVGTLDPENLAASLDLGQLLSAGKSEESARMLGDALELYPTNPELLHWYAHAVWGESWQEAEEIIELILPFKPQDGDVLYDLACTRSLAGNLDESEEFLRRAIASGFRNFSHMEADPDLRNLRSSGRVSEVLKEYR